MFALIAANWFVFLLAFMIGVATAWWVWARYTADVATPRVSVAPPKTVPAPPVAVTPPAPPAAVAPVAAPLMATPKPMATKSATKPKAAPVKKVAAKAPVKPVTLKAAPAKPAAKKANAQKVVEAKAPVQTAPKPKAAGKAKAAPITKASPKPKAGPKPKAVPKPIIPDNLELLKGVGPKLNALLKSLGVTSFRQVANWTAPDIAEIDAKLGNFAGRIGRDDWVDQAKLLVKGDVAGFEKKYGSLGSEIQKG
jgi:predicted flap endonuclease-1-like 5' DNA nuclease